MITGHLPNTSNPSSEEGTETGPLGLLTKRKLRQVEAETLSWGNQEKSDMEGQHPLLAPTYAHRCTHSVYLDRHTHKLTNKYSHAYVSHFKM